MVKGLALEHQRRCLAIATRARQFGEMIEWKRRGIGDLGHEVPNEGRCVAVIEARYHDRVNVLQELLAKGELALDASQSTAPFDRAEWYALLADTGLTPLIAIASDDENAAALALTEQNGRITPLRNWYSFT